MSDTRFLLPQKFRTAGIVLVVIGIIWGYLRFWVGYKPDILSFKMFAVYSSYLETRYFKFVRNNLGEELTAFFLVVGTYFIAFAREKTETEVTRTLRVKSLFAAGYLNLLFLVASIWLTYGLAFVYMLMVNLLSWPLFYIVVFRILLFFSSRNNSSNPQDG